MFERLTQPANVTATQIVDQMLQLSPAALRSYIQQLAMQIQVWFNAQTLSTKLVSQQQKLRGKFTQIEAPLKQSNQNAAVAASGETKSSIVRRSPRLTTTVGSEPANNFDVQDVGPIELVNKPRFVYKSAHFSWSDDSKEKQNSTLALSSSSSKAGGMVDSIGRRKTRSHS
jgi:hypothetical protein